MYKYSSVKWGITKYTVGPMISRFAFANVARSSRDSGTNAIVFAGVGEANVCRKLSKQSWYKLMINSISCHRPLWWHLMHELLINNGNWTEWSAIWPEIICVISKSNESAARVRFEITGMISDQNCTTRSSITTLLQHFEIAEFSQWSGIQFVQKWKQKVLTSNLVFKTGMMRYRVDMMRYRTEMMRFRTWMMLFRKNVT